MMIFFKKILLALCLSLSILGAHPVQAEDAKPGAEYLKYLPKDLYEQPEVYDLSFQSLSVKEQNRVLLKSFISKKYYFLNKEIFYNSLWTVGSSAIAIPTFYDAIKVPAKMFLG